MPYMTPLRRPTKAMRAKVVKHPAVDVQRMTAAVIQKALMDRDAPIAPPTPEQLRTRSLAEFVRDAWPVLEPATPYVHGWHIDAICEHLEAVTRGDIRNLLINVPPRSGKSLVTSVLWPMWVWTFRPAERWLFASYGSDLSERDSLKSRRLIRSPWYQQEYGNRYQIMPDKDTVLRFENDAMGYRMATSVGGVTTGEGGSAVVVDDPTKADDANSALVRERAIRWWAETMTTRLNDPKTGVKVIIMQRLHERDLSGYVLDQGGYEHLCLPMEFEPERRCSVQVTGWTDPRAEPGELLWPERVGPEEVAQLQAELGDYAYAGQMQQRPAPRGGGLFKREWFDIVPARPKLVVARVRYWDKAATPDGNGARTAGVLMSRDGAGHIYVEDVVKGRWSADAREEIIDQTAALDGKFVVQWCEQEPGSGGKESAQATVRRLSLAGYRAHAERVTGDKTTRAEPFASNASAHNVSLVAGPWNSEFLNEIESFPMGRLKDQVDGASGGYNKLAVLTASRPPVAGPPREAFTAR